ncbi:hypothetical protein ACVBEQ_02040 [Nakamurella sp. GG22]
MYAQLTYFDGPRTPELVAAADRAGRERIEPAIMARADLRDDLVAVYNLRRPDGGQITVVIAEHEQTLDETANVIMSTSLLPGEDAALLPGPDRVERYQVVHTAVGA